MSVYDSLQSVRFPPWDNPVVNAMPCDSYDKAVKDLSSFKRAFEAVDIDSYSSQIVDHE